MTETSQKIFGEAYQRKANKGTFIYFDAFSFDLLLTIKGEQQPPQDQNQSNDNVEDADFKDVSDKK